MKNGQNLAHLKQQKEEMEGWVRHQDCMICGKNIGGAYGHWQTHTGEDGWVCSAKCNREQASKPRFPGHEEAKGDTP